MKNNIEVFNKTYEEAIQAFMHKFSRAPLIPGQQVELDQATGRSGHTVHYGEVRAEEIPFIATKSELRYKLFDSTSDPKNLRILNAFRNVIFYYNKRGMKDIPNTNKRSWYVPVPSEAASLARGNRIFDGIPANDFIAPTDVTKPLQHADNVPNKEEIERKKLLYKNLTPTEKETIQIDYNDNFELDSNPRLGQLSEGYAVEIYTKVNDKYELISNNYFDFDYFSGLLIFNSLATQEEINTWANNGIYISAFQYIGKKVLDYFKELELLISKANQAIDRVKNESISVQRITFNTGQCDPDQTTDAEKSIFNGKEKFEDYASPYFNTDKYKQRYVRNYTVRIPGYCWELTFGDQNRKELEDVNLNLGGVFITDIQHTTTEERIENGEKIIKHWSNLTFQLEVLSDSDEKKYENGDKPILAWIDTIENGKVIKKPICGDYNLIATTFTRFDGRSIDVLPDKDLNKIKK